MKEFYELMKVQPSMMYSLLFLIGAYLSAFFFRKQKVVSLACVAVSMFFALSNSQGVGNIFLVVWIALILIAIFCSSLKSKIYLSVIGSLLLLLLGVVGIIHMIPFYTNFKVFSSAYLGSSSISYNLYYNLDKGALGVLLYLFLVRRKTWLKNWKQDLIVSLKVGFSAILLLLSLSYFLDYVAWDPKVPSVSLVWVFCNLFLVCFAEEVFFRGFIFDFFTRKTLYFLDGKEHFWIGYILSSALFGLYHYRLGWAGRR